MLTPSKIYAVKTKAAPVQSPKVRAAKTAQRAKKTNDKNTIFI